MKRLFDHHLSHKLVGRLADLFPDSEPVRHVNLHEADDRTVWEYARVNGFAIVSKDEDFHQLSFLYGAPPKVVWVRLGDCTTVDIEHALRRHHTDVLNFDANEESALLIVGSRRAEHGHPPDWHSAHVNQGDESRDTRIKGHLTSFRGWGLRNEVWCPRNWASIVHFMPIRLINNISLRLI
jgi:predicted nuclease of predicted toxin-antitoxin system